MLRMTDAQVVAYDIIEKILRDYPVINSMDTSEDASRAVISLSLGGFRSKDGRATVHSYPYPKYDD